MPDGKMRNSSAMPDAIRQVHRGGMALLWLIATTLVIVFIAAWAQVGAGSYGMTWGQAFAAVIDAKVWGQPAVLAQFMLGHDLAKALGFGTPDALPTMTLIVWNVRIPRVLTGMMVGINLAFSGSIFQAITRNEMASPYLLGVSSGAGLAILVVLVLCPAFGAFLPLIAMMGGAAAFIVVYAIAWHHGTSSVRLVLAGVIVGSIAGSLQAALFFSRRTLQSCRTPWHGSLGRLPASAGNRCAWWRRGRLSALCSDCRVRAILTCCCWATPPPNLWACRSSERGSCWRRRRFLRRRLRYP